MHNFGQDLFQINSYLHFAILQIYIFIINPHPGLERFYPEVDSHSSIYSLQSLLFRIYNKGGESSELRHFLCH